VRTPLTTTTSRLMGMSPEMKNRNNRGKSVHQCQAQSLH
jgi:hypothetical protein